ncbi:hypothetical protein [Flavobacterium sp. ACN2]|nr:hypothetical protein [Flavobacterium sp. ACN2]
MEEHRPVTIYDIAEWYIDDFTGLFANLRKLIFQKTAMHSR